MKSRKLFRHKGNASYKCKCSCVHDVLPPFRTTNGCSDSFLYLKKTSAATTEFALRAVKKILTCSSWMMQIHSVLHSSWAICRCSVGQLVGQIVPVKILCQLPSRADAWPECRMSRTKIWSTYSRRLTGHWWLQSLIHNVCYLEMRLLLH